MLGIISVPVAGADPCRALVVVGMEDERAIAAGHDVDVVVGTANAKVLRQRLAQVNVAHIGAVYSFGVAGGLDPALKPGDLLVSTRVIAQSADTTQPIVADSWNADQDLLSAIQRQAAKVATVMIRTGVFLGTDFEARDNPQANNQNLRDMSGADIIDNESHIAARFAREHNLPFVSVRAVSDSVSKKLPPAALMALQDDGSPNIAAVAKSILRNPGQIPALIRTAREYKKALNSLRGFRRDIGFLQPASCP
jgi:adenosylhomocysteine nucleosidase